MSNSRAAVSEMSRTELGIVGIMAQSLPGDLPSEVLARMRGCTTVLLRVFLVIPIALLTQGNMHNPTNLPKVRHVDSACIFSRFSRSHSSYWLLTGEHH